MITEFNFNISEYQDLITINFIVDSDNHMYRTREEKIIKPYLPFKDHGKYYNVDRTVTDTFDEFKVMKGLLFRGKRYGQTLLSEDGELIRKTVERIVHKINYGNQVYYI